MFANVRLIVLSSYVLAFPTLLNSKEFLASFGYMSLMSSSLSSTFFWTHHCGQRAGEPSYTSRLLDPLEQETDATGTTRRRLKECRPILQLREREREGINLKLFQVVSSLRLCDPASWNPWPHLAERASSHNL